MISVIASGFTLGMLGSLHCVGMCGPIALALPVHRQEPLNKVLSILSYNLGRVATYSFLGFIFGTIGASLFIDKYQQAFSIILGVLILLGILVPKIFSFLTHNPAYLSFQESIKRRLSFLFQQDKNVSTFFLIGILNGFLPCGLVYMAIAGALVSCSTINGVLFMAMFGVATIPAMYAVSYFGSFATSSLRSKINKAVPVLVGLMAVLLILRGLNLGIPYISPQLKETQSGFDEKCCRVTDSVNVE